jgi:CMP-N,N'-diacetyllegionaminic acid synthase
MSGILGLVPARAGSVGVRGKNVRPLGGRPLIVHTIEAARGSRLDRVVISTDSEQIAAIGAAAGAERPFLRPAELASGTALAIAVVRHALEHFRGSENWLPDAVFYLQPTSPFRSSADIDTALDLFEAAATADSVMSVSLVNEHPAFAWIEEAGRLKPAFPQLVRPERRQDLPPIFIDNNAITLSRTSYLLGDQAPDLPIINLKNFVPMKIGGPIAIDIDNEMQFAFADFLMQAKMGSAA